MAKKMQSTTIVLAESEKQRLSVLNKMIRDRNELVDKIQSVQDRIDDMYSDIDNEIYSISEDISARILKDAETKVKTLPTISDDGREITYDVVSDYNKEEIELIADKDGDFGTIFVSIPEIDIQYSGYALSPEDQAELTKARAIVEKLEKKQKTKPKTKKK